MYRSKEQRQFANRVESHLVSGGAPLLLEGAAGLGKTRGYLAPLLATGKPVAVCGEIAGDAAFVPLLLALGLTELSLHPATLLEVRRAIRGCDLSALRAQAATLLRARDRAGIEQWLASSAPS